MKIVLGIEYDGSQFYGWQRQQKLRTVQFVVETALSQIAATPIQVICAGRTDAGVHAFGQVIHFETDVVRPEKAWVLGTNTHLPNDVVVRAVKKMPEDFHARFSAIKRHYRYIIYNHAMPSAIYRHHVMHYSQPLNVAIMQQAANYLIGEYDFSSFRGAGCQSKTPIREVFSLQIHTQPPFIVIDICANAFLHHMVRNIVGALLAVGDGRKPLEWMQILLQAKDRREGDITAPASGLYLMKVEYPETFEL